LTTVMPMLAAIKDKPRQGAVAFGHP